jgi:hypothetical protein
MLNIVQQRCTHATHAEQRKADLSVVRESCIPMLSPNPAAFVAAKWHCRVKHIPGVHPDSSCLHNTVLLVRSQWKRTTLTKGLRHSVNQYDRPGKKCEYVCTWHRPCTHTWSIIVGGHKPNNPRSPTSQARWQRRHAYWGQLHGVATLASQQWTWRARAWLFE